MAKQPMRRSARRTKVGETLRGTGQWIDVPSETRPDKVHHIYTGDDLNSFHCTCEAFHHGTRSPGELFVCKHVRDVVFGGVV